MRAFSKPNIVISNCLELAPCRYNGQVVHDDFVKKLGKHVNFTPVCPEMAIGLGVPRFPVRLISKGQENRLVQPATDADLTDKMIQFSETFLAGLREDS